MFLLRASAHCDRKLRPGVSPNLWPLPGKETSESFQQSCRAGVKQTGNLRDLRGYRDLALHFQCAGRTAHSTNSLTPAGCHIACLLSPLQSCLTLCDPTDCSPPSPSVHGILQARILESVAMLFSTESYCSTQSWHYRLGDSIRFHRLWTQSPTTLISNNDLIKKKSQRAWIDISKEDIQIVNR